MTAATTPVVEWELAYVEATAPVPVTALAAASADTVVTAPAIDVDGSTPILVHFFTPYVEVPAGGFMRFVAYDGSTQLGEYEMAKVSGGASERGPVNLWRRAIPAAGSHAYSWRAYVGSGSGVAGAGPGGAGAFVPLFIRVALASPRVVKE